MSKFITILSIGILSICPFRLWAQVTLSTADLPDVGVTYPIGIDGYPSIDIGNASPSAQTWDFSTINPISIDTATFAGTEGTPSPADYPNATVTRLAPLSSLLSVSLDALGLPVDLEDATAYYQVGTDGHLYTAGINVPINIAGFIDLGPQSIPADPADLYLPALSFGQSISTEGHYEKELTVTDPLPITATITIDATRTVTADAFGTLVLYGQSYEVLRYNEVLVAHLNANAGILGAIDTTLTIHTLRFMSPAVRFPVASITVEEQEAGPTATYIEYIYTGSNPNVGIDAPSAQRTNWQLYPNPSIDYSYCLLPEDLPAGDYRLNVYNELGQLIADIALQPHTPTRIDTHAWASGLYAVVLRESNNIAPIAVSKLLKP